MNIQPITSVKAPVFTGKVFTNKTYVKVFLYFGLALLITTAVTFGASSVIYNLAINNPEIGIMAYYIFLGVGIVGLFICSLIVSFFCNKKGRGLIVPYVLLSQHQIASSQSCHFLKATILSQALQWFPCLASYL